MGKTLNSILHQAKSSDIYLVDDGSSDSTAQVARKYIDNVATIANRGKAQALNYGIRHFELTNRYKFIFLIDADTQPKGNFLKLALAHFKDDPDGSLACVIGRVKGYGENWISKYREWEYQVAHFIHKRAQANLNSVLVVPGCATVYRSSLFKKLEFPAGTMTEDMDFTFQLHRLGLNEMIFEDKAIVMTQDPQNIRDFVKQLSRWYTGFWQVVKKHEIPWHGQTIDIEATMLGLEGLYNGIVVIFFLLSIIPLAATRRLSIYEVPGLADFFLFFLPTLIWSSVADKDFKRMIYIPHFYFLRFLSSMIFLRSFFRGFLSEEKAYSWESNRYLSKQEAA